MFRRQVTLMNFILYAVPFFFVLIAVELLADRWRKVSNYRVADAINSLSTGVLSTTTGLLTKGVGLVSYAFALEHLALWQLPAQSVWVWVFAFVAYDLCYYWLHRMGHERNILWAAHSVHHQSEDYNLSTALRQTSTGFLLSWIFYLPLAVIGVPLVVFVAVASLNLLYQFWVHTRHIPKLGWFEQVFVTPSNHRAHHAQNLIYMDRNYGGVFIVWDRLFGTFQEELDSDPPVFGVTTPLRSWNPIWAHLQFYARLASDARHTASWKDKLRIWFMRTGWRPADVAQMHPIEKPDLGQFCKYEVPISLARQLYVGVQFSLYTLLGSYLLSNGETLPSPALVLGWGWVAFGLFVFGAALEDRPSAMKLEGLRLAANLPLMAVAPVVGLWQVSALGWVMTLAYTALSAAALYGARVRITRLEGS